ncbi:squalene--hopene cyclase [Verrucomicrobium sp. 3C]|uniref:squalene--hopene cyclase n=1 Tax=Verrucomicrobium sp. 3C TaxID=1134055 RepID=UPI0003A43624|nr:squalene--hopene cyclase [Verrucomicrobium sp. 3C]
MRSGKLFSQPVERGAKTKPVMVIEEALDHALAVGLAIARSQNYLLSTQKPDGHWVGELFADVTLACDRILLMHWLGKVNYRKQARFMKHILDRQLPDGGWNIFPGGPSELNATIKGYAALKLAGFTQQDPLMEKARSTILRLGGIPKSMTYTKLGLALLGVYPWHQLPVIPLEIVLFPAWFPFHLYKMSAWSRTMLVPLAIIHHFKPTRHLPAHLQLHELFPAGTEQEGISWKWSTTLFSKRNVFLVCDKLLQLWDRSSWKPLRTRALKKAEEWMVERIGQGSDGLGAIFPAMHYAIVALRTLGYPEESPLFQKALRDFDGLEVDEGEDRDLRVQPCVSPVWDTAVACVALGRSGLPSGQSDLRKAAAWLMEREIRVRGDWHVNNPHPECSGWAFEYNNIYYPDIDDSLMVLLALLGMKTDDEAKKQEMIERAFRWVLSFQCRNGGWAAFDKDVNSSWLEDVPFADHNAILDPPCSDITARALELAGRMGIKRSEPFVQRGIRFLKKSQGADGSWFGRWGVNYIYGTWQALRGLRAIEEDMNQQWTLRARDWLESCQNEDGGWGETPASYENPDLKGKGPSTASQTAWAIMGILACGEVDRPSLRRGVAYLVRKQDPGGSWREEFITGTGFPGVFYLKYDMYRNAWPLLALSDYAKALSVAKEQTEAWVRATLAVAICSRSRAGGIG